MGDYGGRFTEGIRGRLKSEHRIAAFLVLWGPFHRRNPGKRTGAKSLPRRGLRGGLRAMVVLGRRFTPRERTLLWQVLGSQGLRARERSCIKSPHSIARNWLRMSVLHPFLSMLCKPKRRRPPRPGFQRAAHRTRRPSQSRVQQASPSPHSARRLIHRSLIDQIRSGTNCPSP